MFSKLGYVVIVANWKDKVKCFECTAIISFKKNCKKCSKIAQSCQRKSKTALKILVNYFQQKRKEKLKSLSDSFPSLHKSSLSPFAWTHTKKKKEKGNLSENLPDILESSFAGVEGGRGGGNGEAWSSLTTVAKSMAVQKCIVVLSVFPSKFDAKFQIRNRFGLEGPRSGSDDFLLDPYPSFNDKTG